MNVFENKEIREKLCRAFPMWLVNSSFEFIANPATNTYIMLDGVETELALKAKIIEWFSRAAIKGGSKMSQTYHLDGINHFLGTNFTHSEMEEVYSNLGNAVNHAMTIRFIESGYDICIFKEAHDEA